MDKLGGKHDITGDLMRNALLLPERPVATEFAKLPNWVPEAVQVYLAHTEAGITIRSLARQAGCHASTILRQVRRVEGRRDDPLVDAALQDLAARHFGDNRTRPLLTGKDLSRMSFQSCPPPRAADCTVVDEVAIRNEAPRVLRRLCETGAILAVAADMEKAVIVKETGDGNTTRTGVVDRKIAEALALKNWIAAKIVGKITRYSVTAAGRQALENMFGQGDMTAPSGFADARADFAPKPAGWEGNLGSDTEEIRPRRIRYNLAESPLATLARRKDRDGQPFLSDDLVRAGEQLREDFELGQMGPRMTQNWEKFLTNEDCSSKQGSSSQALSHGASEARQRVAGALQDLGPGLSDVVLQCCCHLQGLETAEKKLGWSARSGKIVLRIALMRLKRYYDDTVGPGGPLIG